VLAAARWLLAPASWAPATQWLAPDTKSRPTRLAAWPATSGGFSARLACPLIGTCESASARRPPPNSITCNGESGKGEANWPAERSSAGQAGRRLVIGLKPAQAERKNKSASPLIVQPACLDRIIK